MSSRSINRRRRRRRRNKSEPTEIEYTKKNLIIIIIVLSIFSILLTNALIYNIVSSSPSSLNKLSLIGIIIFDLLCIGFLIFFIIKLQNK